MDELSFAIYDVSTGEVEPVDPGTSKEIVHADIERGFAEKATRSLYRHHFGHRVEDINQRRKGGRLEYALGIDESYRSQSWEMPAELGERVLGLIQDNLDVDSQNEASRIASVDGIPDILTCVPEDHHDFRFVEAKRGREKLLQSQVDWFRKFDFLPIRIVYVFNQATACERFVQENSLEELLAEAGEPQNLNMMEGRGELTDEEIARRVAGYEVGDRVTFNDRKTPLEVVGADDEVWKVRGSEETGVELVSTKGNKYLLSDSGEFFVEKENRRDLKWVSRPPDV